MKRTTGGLSSEATRDKLARKIQSKVKSFTSGVFGRERKAARKTRFYL